jgi:hypothetical protein
MDSFLAVLCGIGGMVCMRLRLFGVWLLESDSTIDEPEAIILIHWLGRRAYTTLEASNIPLLVRVRNACKNFEPCRRTPDGRKSVSEDGGVVRPLIF